MRFLKVIFSTIIVLLGIVFIIENLEDAAACGDA